MALGTLIETKKGRLGWSAPQACIQASASCEPAWAASPAGQSVLSWRQPACSSYPQPPLGLISALAASHFGCLPGPAPPPALRSPLPHHSFLATARFQPKLGGGAWREGVASVCVSPAGFAQCLSEDHPVLITKLCGPGEELGKLCSALSPTPAHGPGHPGQSAPRSSPTVWLATQNHSTLVTERSAVPFLPVNPEYSATRNQVRSLGGGLGLLLPFQGSPALWALPSSPAIVWAWAWASPPCPRPPLAWLVLRLGREAEAALLSTW